MVKTRLRTAAMDTDKGTVPHSEITGVENSPFVLLESRLLRLLPGVDWWLPG
jgi:hypothetical protein